MSINTYLRHEPVELPKIGSWPHAWHVFDEPSAYALAAAEAAERPLLIRGEPGTGKSQLARAAAVIKNRLFLSVVVDARTECQDLQWKFDTVARLGEAQILAHEHGGDVSTLRERMDPRRFLTPGPLWLAFDWTSAKTQYEQCDHRLESPPTPPEGWLPAHGSVLLIDEIDKADTDLPNGLLETLGNSDFSVPYLGESVRRSSDCPAPLVVITTNEERELPAAFLRRCLVLQLSLPEDRDDLSDLLCERGRVHFRERCTDEVRRKAAELLLEDRQSALDQGLPPPGQAEYLDLLRAVSGMATSERDQLALLDRIGEFVLRKSPPS